MAAPKRIAPADRALAAEELNQIFLRTSRLPGYTELFEASLSSAGMVGHSEKEIGELRRRAVQFVKAHTECAQFARRALARMRAAYPRSEMAPMEDLQLLGDIVGQAVVSPIQVVRGQSLAARLATGDTSAFGILETDVCIPGTMLEPLGELADVSSAAMVLAVRERPAGGERCLDVVRNFHWAASYFVHNPVCSLGPGELGTRIRRRLAQWRGYPENAAGQAARDMLLRVWDIAVQGGGNRARRDLAGALEAVERVGALLGGAPAPKNDLIRRIRNCAGGEKPR